MNSKSIPNALRKLVFERAAERCEYCLIHQKASMYSHEIDHIIRDILPTLMLTLLARASQ